MTNQEFQQFLLEGSKLTNEEKLSTIKLSNYNKIAGFESVIVKRNGIFKTIHSFYLEMFENVYTGDYRLIANRIA